MFRMVSSRVTISLLAMILLSLSACADACDSTPLVETDAGDRFRDPLPTEPEGIPDDDGGQAEPDVNDGGEPEDFDGGEPDVVDGGDFEPEDGGDAFDAGGEPEVVPCVGDICVRWEAVGAPTVNRARHTATKLLDGRVLLAGGTNGTALASAEIFDPDTDTFVATGSMASGRFDHEAVLLNDGRVLIAGGSAGVVYLTEVEIFDPATGLFTAGGPLSAGRLGHSLTKRADGTILVAGGLNATEYPPAVEVISATGATTTTGPTLGAPRYIHGATLLANGSVLLAGGRHISDILNNVEIFTTGGTLGSGPSMPLAQSSFSMSTLTDGRALAVGGSSGGVLASAYAYNPVTAEWLLTGSLTTARLGHSAVELSDGRLLFTGGTNTARTLREAETFDPETDTFTATVGMTRARLSHSATLLDDGRVLVVGGTYSTDPGIVTNDDAEVYIVETTAPDGGS